MSDQLVHEQETVLEELTTAVGQDIIEGKNKEIIVQELVAQDWQENSAVEFVDSVELDIREYQESPEGRREQADQYSSLMLSGFLWAAGGTFITVATYQAASQGGTYFIAWGAIVFGIYDFFRGFFGWLNYQD